jgi:CRISPR-associated protein Cas1
MASHTLPHSSAVSQLPRHGMLCLFGFGVRVSVVNGNLSCHDGIGNDRRTVLLSKINSNLKRLVIIGSDGMISLEALRWVADRDAALLVLDRRGKVLVVCGPTAPSDARLHRSQVLALENGTALRISKELIRQKLEGQASLANDMLHDSVASNAIERFKTELTRAESIESVRLIESQAARVYWQSWADVSIQWVRKDERRVPDHWKRFRSRISPLTRSPRLASSPPNALLNILYSLCESEARLSAVAMGFNPALGLLHVDTPNRDSLACDLQEPIRAAVDAFVLDWLQSEPLRKCDFWEERNGNCRVSPSLAIKLCETACTWRHLLAPVAEYVARELWLDSSSKGGRILLATRLTQRHKREAKGASPLPSAIRPPRRENLCRGCGKIIRSEHTNCADCAICGATERLVRAARLGRLAARSPEARAKHVASRRRHAQACSAWDASSQPAWLSDQIYSEKIQPLVARTSASAIALAIGVSRGYAGRVRQGYRPHPRHWQALAELVGFVGNQQSN